MDRSLIRGCMMMKKKEQQTRNISAAQFSLWFHFDSEILLENGGFCLLGSVKKKKKCLWVVTDRA